MEDSELRKLNDEVLRLMTQALNLHIQMQILLDSIEQVDGTLEALGGDIIVLQAKYDIPEPESEELHKLYNHCVSVRTRIKDFEKWLYEGDDSGAPWKSDG